MEIDRRSLLKLIDRENNSELTIRAEGDILDKKGLSPLFRKSEVDMELKVERLEFPEGCNIIFGQKISFADSFYADPDCPIDSYLS